MVEAAGQRDFDALCRLNGSVLNRRRQLDVGCDDRPDTPPKISCRDTVLDEPPAVASSRYSPKGSAGDTPGRILVVKGIDGAGEAYTTEVFVFRENRHNFKAINAVYWSNARIIENGATTPGVQPMSLILEPGEAVAPRDALHRFS